MGVAQIIYTSNTGGLHLPVQLDPALIIFVSLATLKIGQSLPAGFTRFVPSVITSSTLTSFFIQWQGALRGTLPLQALMAYRTASGGVMGGSGVGDKVLVCGRVSGEVTKPASQQRQNGSQLGGGMAGRVKEDSPWLSRPTIAHCCRFVLSATRNSERLAMMLSPRKTKQVWTSCWACLHLSRYLHVPLPSSSRWDFASSNSARSSCHNSVARHSPDTPHVLIVPSPPLALYLLNDGGSVIFPPALQPRKRVKASVFPSP